MNRKKKKNKTKPISLRRIKVYKSIHMEYKNKKIKKKGRGSMAASFRSGRGRERLK